MPIENEQSSESFTDEIQKEAGYLLRHHTRTQTWDERIRLDSLATKKAELEADIAAKQDAIAKLDLAINASADALAITK